MATVSMATVSMATVAMVTVAMETVAMAMVAMPPSPHPSPPSLDSFYNIEGYIYIYLFQSMVYSTFYMAHYKFHWSLF